MRFLDNDLYKFTMQQAVLELFPDATAEYTFINRGTHKFTEKFLEELIIKISYMPILHLTKGEKNWFSRTCKYLKPNYFEYLQNYRFDPSDLSINLSKDNTLNLKICGPWYKTILWEVPLLALISETYFETIDKDWVKDYAKYKEIIKEKFRLLDSAGCYVSDFGTRRRRNFKTQNITVGEGRNFSCFSGTSNVHLSRVYDLVPKGTMAHEWIMAMSILEGLRNANYYALQNWVRVFNANLGIALTDTYGLNAFLNNFGLRLAKLYDGVRHDSGDPFEFVDKIVGHYEDLRINSMSKIAFFSDNLSPEKAIEINEYCKGKIGASFGIGTNLTNDFSFCGSPALNMVIKMSKLNGVSVVKLSDESRKECGDKDAIRVARWTFYNKSLDGGLCNV